MEVPGFQYFVEDTPKDMRKAADEMINRYNKANGEVIEEIKDSRDAGRIDKKDSEDLLSRMEHVKSTQERGVKDSATTALESKFGDGDETKDFIYELD
jgi:hypothetical protein